MIVEEYKQILNRMRNTENAEKYNNINMNLERTDIEESIWDINKKIQGKLEYLKKVNISEDIGMHERDIRKLMKLLLEYLDLDGWK